MKSNVSRGTDGERDVISKVPCPNCGKRLIALPKGFPLFDVQCTRCVFRAQVKTNHSKPKDEIFGAGRVVLNHALRSGQLIPPLIANFHWKEGRKKRQVVILYPFLTQKNIRKRTRGAAGARPGYKEFNYLRLKHPATPRMTLLDK